MLMMVFTAASCSAEVKLSPCLGNRLSASAGPGVRRSRRYLLHRRRLARSIQDFHGPCTKSCTHGEVVYPRHALSARYDGRVVGGLHEPRLALLGVALGVLLGLAACSCRQPPAPLTEAGPSVVDVGELSLTVGKALGSGDAAAVVALLPPTDIGVRVEVRQLLVETDERTAETLRSGDAVREWLGKIRARWTCVDDGCAWPGGLMTGELSRCMGDCCFSDYPGGIDEQTLYLKRVCFAARDRGDPRLSYIEFVEAR